MLLFSDSTTLRHLFCICLPLYLLKSKPPASRAQHHYVLLLTASLSIAQMSYKQSMKGHIRLNGCLGGFCTEDEIVSEDTKQLGGLRGTKGKEAWASGTEIHLMPTILVWK